MGFFQKLLVKMVLGNREKLIALALAELAKVWKVGRAHLIDKIVEVVEQSPLAASATEAEIDALVLAIEAWFGAKEFNEVEKAIVALLKK